MLRLVSRTLLAWAFLWISCSSSLTGGTNDLEEAGVVGRARWSGRIWGIGQTTGSLGLQAWDWAALGHGPDTRAITGQDGRLGLPGGNPGLELGATLVHSLESWTRLKPVLEGESLEGHSRTHFSAHGDFSSGGLGLVLPSLPSLPFPFTPFTSSFTSALNGLQGGGMYTALEPRRTNER